MKKVSRRNFLKSASILAIAAALSPEFTIEQFTDTPQRQLQPSPPLITDDWLGRLRFGNPFISQQVNTDTHTGHPIGLLDKAVYSTVNILNATLTVSNPNLFPANCEQPYIVSTFERNQEVEIEVKSDFVPFRTPCAVELFFQNLGLQSSDDNNSVGMIITLPDAHVYRDFGKASFVITSYSDIENTIYTF